MILIAINDALLKGVFLHLMSIAAEIVFILSAKRIDFGASPLRSTVDIILASYFISLQYT